VAPEAVLDLETRFAADEQAQLRGNPPATHLIVSSEAGSTAAYKALDAVNFYLQPVPDGIWRNEVTLRSTRWARMYAPGDFIERVSPTPLLMVVADHDHVAVTDLALKAFERALEPKHLVMIKGGHFDPYVREFKAASEAAVGWFKAHLT
jgi:fermentation-respiration switch protein FrsA (DUF1100 family)